MWKWLKWFLSPDPKWEEYNRKLKLIVKHGYGHPKTLEKE